MRTRLSISLGLALALSAGWTRADPPAPPPAPAPPAAPEVPSVPGARIAVGQAPVVGGNAAGARERAMDEAIRQAVDLALAELVGPQTRAAQAKAIRTLEAKARTFVPRYRTLEEGEANGVYTVRLQAEVDEPALRAKIERWSAGPAAAETGRGVPGALIVGPGDDAPQTAALVTGVAAALAAAGVRARASQSPPPGATVVRVGASVSDAGPVRGTSRVAAACTGAARFVPASAPERQAAAFGFADDAEAARNDCLARLAPALGAAVAAGWSPASIQASDLPVRTIEADVVDPAAVAALLKSVRAVGAVSSADLVQVGGGHAEIRARTRAAPGALAEALVRDADATLSLTDVQAGADSLSLRVRLRAPTTGSSP